MIASLFFATSGGLLISMAILSWRHRHKEMVNLLEAAILKTAGAKPLPLTRLDRALQMLHIIMASIMGPLFLFLGVAMLLKELGIVK